jgi:hypothetical protein
MPPDELIQDSGVAATAAGTAGWLMEERTRLVVVVGGLHGSAGGALCCLGRHVVNMVVPGDPVVGVGQTSADPKPSHPARAAHRGPPRGGLLARAEPGRRRPVSPQLLKACLIAASSAFMPPSQGSRCRRPALSRVGQSGGG